MQTNFYNTEQATHPELGQYEKKAKSQEDRILEWFKANEGNWSPSIVKEAVFSKRTPITSVRRAITNLTLKDELVKSDIQTKGPFGHKEFHWKLAEKYDQRPLF